MAMGAGLLAFYRDRLKRVWKTAFASAFFIGLLVHLYKFTNTLYSRDSVLNDYATQNVVRSGRWFLCAACSPSTWFDLPWVIGLFSLVLIGLTAAVIADLFRMENPVVVVLASGLLAAFPALSATFFYEYTADGYMLAMLLAALAARLTAMGGRGALRWIAAGVCLCLSCGIYQAYVSFALLLSICHFLQEALEGNRSDKECLRWVGGQAAAYAGGLAAYYGIWRLCLRLEDFQATGYQGIDQVGKVDGDILRAAVEKVFQRLREFLLDWEILGEGWTLYAALNALFLAALALGLLLAAYRSGLYRRPVQLALGLLAVLAAPFAACIWYFTSPAVEYHPLMLQSLAVPYLFAAVLYERWFPPRASSAAGLLLAAILLNFSLQANISYFYLHRCYETSYQTCGEMLGRIHLLTDMDPVQIIVVGSTAFGKSQLDWSREARAVHNMSQLLQKSLAFDQGHLVEFMRITFDCDLVYPPGEEQHRLRESPEAASMPCWPADGSIAVIDGTVVIKLSD